MWSITLSISRRNLPGYTGEIFRSSAEKFSGVCMGYSLDTGEILRGGREIFTGVWCLSMTERGMTERSSKIFSQVVR